MCKNKDQTTVSSKVTVRKKCVPLATLKWHRCISVATLTAIMWDRSPHPGNSGSPVSSLSILQHEKVVWSLITWRWTDTAFWMREREGSAGQKWNGFSFPLACFLLTLSCSCHAQVQPVFRTLLQLVLNSRKWVTESESGAPESEAEKPSLGWTWREQQRQ